MSWRRSTSVGRRIAIFVLADRLRLLQGFTSDTDLLLQSVNQTGASSLTGYRAELTYREMREAAAAESPAAGTGSVTGSGTAPATASGHPASSTAAWEKRSGEMNKNAERDFASELLDNRVDRTLDSLVQISRFLSGLPGRKNLIWYSGSFPA